MDEQKPDPIKLRAADLTIPFDDLSADEKIERLRQQDASHQNQIDHMRSILTTILLNHVHDGNGTVQVDAQLAMQLANGAPKRG